MDVIAEQRLDLTYPDGEAVPVTLRVARPRPDPAHPACWGCVAEAAGLRVGGKSTEIFGEGSLHALMLATGFLRRMLDYEVARGAVASLDGGPLDVGVLFGLPNEPPDSPGASDVG